MRPILKMAIKDIKLLLRDRMGAFFIVGFPILMGVLFGVVMSGPSSGGSRSKMKIAIVDQDQSEISKKFVSSLANNENLDVEDDNVENAVKSVRKGKRVAAIVLPDGFGESAGVLWGDPPKIQLAVDPSRAAEASMMQGFVMEAMGSLVGERFNNPQQMRPMVKQSLSQIEEADDLGFLQRQALKTMMGSFDSMLDSLEDLQEADNNADADSDADSAEGSTGQVNMQFAEFEALDITREYEPGSVRAQTKKLRSQCDISFPQAMMWGVMACVAGFAISIARENTMGTMLRLQASPLTRFQILAGKALACGLTTIGVICLLLILGLMLGLRPLSFPKLAVAAICVAICFVGIMMSMAVLGKTEQSVNGIGWAINMVMSMIGGGMIPVMFMPSFMQNLSVISPVKWGILSVEGAIWRDFSWAEMATPCLVLIAIGIVGVAIGTALLNRRSG